MKSYTLLRCTLLLQLRQLACITAFGGLLVNHHTRQSSSLSQFISNERKIIRSSFSNKHDVQSKIRANKWRQPTQSVLFSTTEEQVITINGESSANSTVDLEDGFEEIEGVICARGVCVIAEEESSELCVLTDDESTSQIICEPKEPSIQPGLTIAYLWPRALLLVCSVLYGTNFPLGRLMNDSLPASAATSTRMLLASIALSPFLFQLKPQLRNTALLCGTFTALGYISQSIALVDTPAATVSFLGALVVIVCPALAVAVDKKKMGFQDAPQTWISAVLCLVGVGLLELGGGSGGVEIGWGDFWSVLQAVGFGTSFFITERMMAREPSQALPITATQCAVSALLSAMWALGDGVGAFNGAFEFGPYGSWLSATADESLKSAFTLPGLFFNVDYTKVAAAAAFTGFITTAGNRVGETIALGKLSSSEASVLLATEPLWAALFANYLIGEELGVWDAIGGAIIVISCVFTAVEPGWLREKLGIEYENDM